MSNLIYGRCQLGRYIWADGIKKQGQGGDVPPSPAGDTHFIPNHVQVIFYNKDGTKTAIFGNNTEDNSFSQLQFELIKNGCGGATLSFKKFPNFTEIMYGQRIDIYLFGDTKPWYSGHVLTRPDSGGTSTDYKITCYGYYDRLEQVLIFGEYNNMEITDIVKDI